MQMTYLDEPEWRAHAAAHTARVDEFIAPHLERRGSATKHPVHDFLFTYYSQRPVQLRRWHPGFGVVLRGDVAAYDGLKGYAVDEVPDATTVTVTATVTVDYVASQLPLLTALHRLLRATASRPAHVGCFGLHEWAMVYRLDEDDTRHAD